MTRDDFSKHRKIQVTNAVEMAKLVPHSHHELSTQSFGFQVSNG
jgi:hypothetical protein